MVSLPHYFSFRETKEKSFTAEYESGISAGIPSGVLDGFLTKKISAGIPVGFSEEELGSLSHLRIVRKRIIIYRSVSCPLPFLLFLPPLCVRGFR